MTSTRFQVRARTTHNNKSRIIELVDTSRSHSISTVCCHSWQTWNSSWEGYTRRGRSDLVELEIDVVCACTLGWKVAILDAVTSSALDTELREWLTYVGRIG